MPSRIERCAHKRHRAALAERLEDRRLLTVSLVSQNAGGSGPGDAASGVIADVGPVNPVISSNGRFIAFVSQASNLIASGDANSAADVFLRDRQTGFTTLISVASGGGSGNGRSGISPLGYPDGISISADGRFVAFVSDASNLVANDGNGSADVFVRDTQLNTTTLVSVAAGGGSGAVGGGSAGSGSPKISADGRFVAFASTASNLVAEQDADSNQADVFLRDLQASTTRQLSKPASGQSAVATAGFPSISDDGRHTAFVAGDTLMTGVAGNGTDQVYVYDAVADSLMLASPSSATGSASTGAARLPAISGNGRVVAFLSDADDLIAGFTDGNGEGNSLEDVFVRNLDANQTMLASGAAGSTTTGGNGRSFAPSISSDGRYVAFKSEASNLSAAVSDINFATDVFVRDVVGATTAVASVTAAGPMTGNGASGFTGAGENQPPGLSADGRFVLFTSQATDIVPADTLPVDDLYVRDLQAGVSRWLSTNATNNAFGSVSNAAISSDGVIATFISDQFNLIPTDNNNAADVFAAIVAEGTTGGGGSSGLIDLTVAVEGSLPTAAVGGQKVKARPIAIVTNGAQQATATGTLTVNLFLSTNTQFDGSDVSLGSISKNVKLKAGKSISLKPKIMSFPVVSAGSYFLLAVVDSNGTIAETNTGNNIETSAQPIQIAVPLVDLSNQVVSSPASVVRGKRTTLPIRVTNAGNILASGTANAVITAIPTGGGAPLELATVPVKVKLTAASAKTFKLKVPIPESLTPGSYTFSVTLSAVNPLADVNTSNDTALAASPFTVG